MIGSVPERSLRASPGDPGRRARAGAGPSVRSRRRQPPDGGPTDGSGSAGWAPIPPGGSVRYEKMISSRPRGAEHRSSPTTPPVVGIGTDASTARRRARHTDRRPEQESPGPPGNPCWPDSFISSRSGRTPGAPIRVARRGRRWEFTERAVLLVPGSDHPDGKRLPGLHGRVRQPQAQRSDDRGLPVGSRANILWYPPRWVETVWGGDDEGPKGRPAFLPGPTGTRTR